MLVSFLIYEEWLLFLDKRHGNNSTRFEFDIATLEARMFRFRLSIYISYIYGLMRKIWKRYKYQSVDKNVNRNEY